MDTDRILELAGVSKAVGTRPAFMLNESKEKLYENAAKQFIRGLEIYQHAMKDPRAKPAALKAAMAFVNDMGGAPISPQAGKFIEDQLTNIVNDANPRGAFMSSDEDEPDATDEFGEDPAAVSNAPEEKMAKVVAAGQKRKEAASRPKQSRIPASDALSWLRQNPGATAKEFVGKAVEAGMNPRTARAKFYKEKKRMAARAAITGESVNCYIIKKGEDVLSERSRPLIPHWIKDDDFNTDFYVFESKEQAEEARSNFILHVSEQMEIVELDADEG